MKKFPISSLLLTGVTATLVVVTGCSTVPPDAEEETRSKEQLVTCGSPAGHPGEGTMPAHANFGYWHNFNNAAGCPIRLRDVPDYWDVINVSFAEYAPAGNISFHLFPGNAACPTALNECDFKQDIADLQAEGKIVNISLGGAEGTISMSDINAENTFVTNMTAMINEYGFNGIDVDYEGASGFAVGAPIITHMTNALKRINTNLGGDMFLSMAPEHPYVHGAVSAYGGIWGSYLALIDGTRNELDVLHTQLYNNGGVPTPQTAAYNNKWVQTQGTVDNLVASVKMLVEGFSAAGGTYTFAPLPASKIALALPSGPQAANSASLHSTQVIKDAYDCITTDTNCGAIHMAQPQSGFRGLMSWSINWDLYDIAHNVGNRVDFAAMKSHMGGTICNPTTSCAAQGDTCGTIFNGCNNVNCGTCSAGQTCNAGTCQTATCTPTTSCAAQGAVCGSINNGCNSVSCGTCAAGSTCQGNSCVTPPPPPTGQSPYGGTAPTLPGRVQAENYDLGGSGVAYSDFDASNNGGAFRPTEGVDLEACSEGGFNVGWVRPAEWIEYTVDTAGGTFDVDFRVASSPSGTFHMEIDGVNVTGAMNVAATGGWQSWTTVTKTGINISSGTHVIRFVTDTGEFNLNFMDFRASSCNGVTVFQNTLFGGTSKCLAQGTYTTSQLSALGVPNNWVSSLRVKSGLTAVLFDGDNFTGSSIQRTSDDDDLVPDGWNDVMSSIQVTAACVPTTSCSAAGADCGTVWNGCANEVCGTCTGGNVCEANECVTPTCTPTTSCSAQGAVCGTINNGCATVACGTCGSGQSCNTSNQCVTSGGTCSGVPTWTGGQTSACYYPSLSYVQYNGKKYQATDANCMHSYCVPDGTGGYGACGWTLVANCN